MKVLVTGANGFIGCALCSRLQATAGFEPLGSVREASVRGSGEGGCAAPIIAVAQGLTPSTDWSIALQGIQAVVHTGARVHVMNDSSTDPLTEYRRINVQGTIRLARQAADAGVQRFIFISSAKVNGEMTVSGRLFTADDIPCPVDGYAISKWEAEQELQHIARVSSMELVVVRAPLVYGPGVKANFAALLRAIKRGWPLPLGAIHNQRSYVALDNLVDFIMTCLLHPQAANQTFMVSDGQDMSTRDLALGLARAAGVPARLLPVPVWILQLGAAALGDIGSHFPDSDPKFQGADSVRLLAEAAQRVRNAGFEIGNIDSTVVAQAPRLAPHIAAMRERIAAAIGVEVEQVNVKAKTAERLGPVGQGLAMEARAVALIFRSSPRAAEAFV